MVLKQRLSATAAHNSMLGFLIRHPKDSAKDGGAGADRAVKRQRVAGPVDTRPKASGTIAKADGLANASSGEAKAEGEFHRSPGKGRESFRQGEVRKGGRVDGEEIVLEGDGDVDFYGGQRGREGQEEEDGEAEMERRVCATDLESAMPAFIGDEEKALEEYEAFRASQEEDKGALKGKGLGLVSGKVSDEPSRTAGEEEKIKQDGKKWVRGRSSIYVDAFKLALETVLDEEAHLFDERERTIFKAWNELSYEAQYL